MNIEAVAYDFTISWKWDSIFFERSLLMGFFLPLEAQQQQRCS